MGLNTFSTALSGLDSSTMGLNVVGNNLANLNTVGFKESNITFSEVLGQQFSTPGGNMNHIGLGSQVQAIREEFSQGSVQSSNNPLDVAIQGQGMLILDDNGSRAYTRAGNMHLDAGGNLVAGAGANVQGYLRDAVTGLINRAAGLQDIVVPNNLVAPTPTTEFELGMNLDAAAATGATFSSTVQLFDSQGTAHMATLSMVKDVTGGATPVTRWRYDITIPTDEIAGSTPGDTTPFSLLTGATATASPAAGALVFNGSGTLTSAYIGADPLVNPPLADLTVPAGQTMVNGGTLSALNWKLIADNGTPNVSGFASSSEVTASSQNGAASGIMSSLSIRSDGTLAAIFNNGTTIDVTAPNSIDGLGKNNASFTGYYFKKYIPADVGANWWSNSYNDEILIRYAEVLLTYAEAKIEANDIDASVYDAINQIRQRTGVNQPAVTPADYATQADLRTLVRRERHVEFAVEPQRLFDIRRWKTAEIVMPGNAYGILNNFDPTRSDYGQHILVESRNFDPARDYLWAIPQNELDLNKNLTQNTSW